MKLNRLMLLSVLFSLLLINEVSAKTWTVDDDLLENPDADFTKIQDAIDASNDGDVIIVNAGLYSEELFIEKEIILTSNNNVQNTILSRKGEGDLVRIHQSNVVFNGFTLVCEWGSNYDGIFVSISDNVTISNNIINGTELGINVSQNNNLIINNTLNDVDRGINIFNGDFNSVKNNQVNNPNMDGISIRGDNNIITNNSVYDCAEEEMDLRGDFNVVYNNILIDDVNTLYFFGIVGKYNNISYNYIKGLNLGLSEAFNNTVYKNYFNLTEIRISNSGYNNIYNNDIIQYKHNKLAPKTHTDLIISLYDSRYNKFYMNNVYYNSINLNDDSDYNVFNSSYDINYIYGDESFSNVVSNYFSQYSSIDEDNNGLWDISFVNNGVKNNNPLVGPYIDGVIQTPETNTSNDVSEPTEKEETAGEPDTNQSDTHTIAPETDTTGTGSESEDETEEEQDTSTGIPSFPLVSILVSLGMYIMFTSTWRK